MLLGKHALTTNFSLSKPGELNFSQWICISSCSAHSNLVIDLNPFSWSDTFFTFSEVKISLKHVSNIIFLANCFLEHYLNLTFSSSEFGKNSQRHLWSLIKLGCIKFVYISGIFSGKAQNYTSVSILCIWLAYGYYQCVSNGELLLITMTNRHKLCKRGSQLQSSLSAFQHYFFVSNGLAASFCLKPAFLNEFLVFKIMFILFLLLASRVSPNQSY